MVKRMREEKTEGSALLMVVSLIMVLMTVSVVVITVHANENRIIDLYKQKTASVFNALTLNRGMPDGTKGTAYSAYFIARGGSEPYTYSLTAGALPAGLTLNGSTGLLSGTPSATGSFTFKVKVTDALGNTCEREYVITIVSGEMTFNDYLIANNLYVFGNVLTITGSSTIDGPDAMVCIKEDSTLGDASINYVATKTIYFEGDVYLHNCRVGITGGRSSVYIDGDVNIWGGSNNDPRIHGDLYYTGDLNVASYLNPSRMVTHTINHVDTITPPNYPIPPLKPAQWYQDHGYTSNSTIRDNMKYYGPAIVLRDTGNNHFYNSIIASTGNITLSGNVHGSGILFAPNGKVEINGSSTFVGIIVAREVLVSGNSHVTFQAVANAEDLPF